MNVDPDGNNSKRILYALATGMAFLLFEMAGTIKGAITALSTLIGFLVGYKDWKNAKEQKKAEVAKKMIKNSRMLKKKLVNEAKRALRKKGIKILATMVGLSWAVAIDVFGTGFYHGWKKSNYNNGLCSRWGRNYVSYAAHVAKKEA